MRWLSLLLVSVSPSFAAADSSPESGALEWKWEEGVTRRWLMETEVNLPQFMWLSADRTYEARVRAFQVSAVVECQLAGVQARSNELACTFTDIAIRAAAITGDAGKGLLDPILSELAQKAFTSKLQVIQRFDGDLTHIDLDDVQKRDTNRKTMRMDENLRLILVRAISGLELRMPKGGASPDGLWAEYDATLMLAPSMAGSNAGVEIIHHVIERRADCAVVIETAGRGTVTSVELASNTLATEMSGITVFDTASGAMLERVWTVNGMPTASSSMAEGYAGIPYVQVGRLRALGPNEQVDVGLTGESALPGADIPSLQRWTPIGAKAGMVVPE